ncbi:MAG: hypothetical protein Q8L56_12785 [Rhodocyclaceae bacterium]|nr:hypothetical protein [Rhodocyclaceae bacterium]
MFKVLRIIILLLILATVAQTAWLARSRATAWENTLTVGIYPIAADDSANTKNYIGTLKPDTFRVIDGFFDEEAKRYGLSVWRPVSVTVAPPLTDRPPQPPRNANALQAIFWSLQMRWWASRHDRIDGPKPAVRLFVLFHDPEINPRLAHSVGIERGMLGVINAFSSQSLAGSNAMIVAHELMHTLGATDKYDPATNRPLYPDGYAEPEREPHHPQEFAEIMGGRIPLSPTEADTPRSLAHTLVGPVTAREIGWLRK